jgi:hypothetical protein
MSLFWWLLAAIAFWMDGGRVRSLFEEMKEMTGEAIASLCLKEQE